MAAATLVGLVLCLGAGAIQLAQSASAHFVDSPTTQYLKAQTAEQQLNAPELRATLKSLLSFQTIGSLSRASAAKVDTWLQGDVFARPSTVLALQIAGVGRGQLTRLAGSQALGLEFQAADKNAANELAQVVGTVGSESSQDLARLPLDHTGLPGCSDACVEESLKAFLAQAGANYSAGQGAMTGMVSFRSAPSAEVVVLDLHSMPVRLWALEVATLYQAANDAASEKLRWEAQQQRPAQHVTLADATLVSMQALNRMYGPGSSEVEAAWSLLAGAVSHARQALLQAHADRVVMVVSLLGDVPKRTQPGKIGELMAWQDANRRRSLLQIGAETGTSSEPHIKYFVIAAAWISCIMLLVFAVAGCYCLSNMEFKQDSLLYPRQKAD